jgi:CheY-like chemotaxis protein
MPSGGTLTISASSETVADHHSKPTPGQYIRLSIADTGQGMDEATMARAIEPFFSTKEVGKGTGLGLSMVEGLVAQLGGALVLSSKLGQGTTVELWLPVSEQPVKAVDSIYLIAPETKAIGRVLLVDDEPLVRASAADMLTDTGYEVVEAASAAEALLILDSELHFDFLVSDLLMAGMTGIDLTRAVNEKRPGLRTLIISGFAGAETIAPELARLAKPFRQSELAASLADLRDAAS